MYAPFGAVEKPGADLLPPNDKGRFAVTKTATDEYVFKVPTLRNIALTAPYFHTGRSWDLRQAVAVMGTSQLGTELTSQEIDNVVAFLGSLTGEPAEAGVSDVTAECRGNTAAAALIHPVTNTTTVVASEFRR